MADERGFLDRWSRRKRDAAAGVPDPEQTPELPADEVSELEAQANREAAEAVDIEALGQDSDYTVFLKNGVPDALRRRALRKLWRSNPVFACLDGLNDYDEHFADPSLNMAVFKSAWQVGRGYLKDEAPADGAARPAEDTQVENPPAEPAAPAVPITDTEPAPPLQVAAEAESSPEAESPSEESEAAPVRVSLRRRLGLQSDDQG